MRDFELCPPCYNDGRFPSTMFSGDFVKLTTTTVGVNGVDIEEKAGQTDWTDAETLLLLEGIELYDDDWVAISEHVGTKSREACVLKFLQLPIEEGYDDEGLPSADGGLNGSIGTNGVKKEGDLGLLRFGRIPFDKADNPVLSVAAFLAGVKGADKAGLKQLGNTDGVTIKSEAMEVDEPTTADGAKSSTLKGALALPPTSRTAHLAMHHTAVSSATLAADADIQLRGTLNKLVEAQVKKLELKIAQFEELEEALEEERRGVEALRLSLLSERAGVRRWVERMQAQGAAGAVNPATLNSANAILASGSGGRLQMMDVDPMTIGEAGGPIPGGSFGTLV